MRYLEMISEFEFLRDNDYLKELSDDTQKELVNESVYDRVDALELNDEEFEWLEDLIIDYIKTTHNIKVTKI